MLNEMMLLRRTLGELGVSTTPRHPHIMMLGKGSPLLRVFLTSEGAVASVEVISQDLAPKYWTFRDGKQNSFPRISFKPALRKGATEEQLAKLTNKRKSLEQRRDDLMALNEQLPIALRTVLPWVTEGHRERIKKRGDELAGGNTPATDVFRRLVDAFLKSNDETLLPQIETAVIGQLVSNPSEELLTLGIRLCFLDGAKSAKPSDACDVIFDFEDPKSLQRAADPGMVAVLSNALSSSSQEDDNGVCSLTGVPARIEDDKFPEAALPVLGPTYLHTRNTEIPSAHRYRVSGPASMPVGRTLASEIQAAAEELTNPDRKGKTWTSIASEKSSKPDLLVCYLPGLLDLDLADSLVESEAKFEKLGERIVELTKGKSVVVPETARIEIAVFRQIDKANKKTVHSCSLTRRALENAAISWTQACKNVPDVKLFLPVKKGEKALLVGPRTLTPGGIVALSKKVYMTGGTKCQEISGLSFSEAFAVVMGGEQNDPIHIRTILGFTLQRFTPLLIGIGHVRSRLTKSRCKPDMESFKPEHRRDALGAISLIGALLFQLDIKISNNMNTRPYLLGQLLAGSDILHRGYCLEVRGGQLPPKLMGNAALTTAAQNPAAALAQLMLRWPPYEGWARKRMAENTFDRDLGKLANDDKKKNRIYDIRAGAFSPIKLREIAEQLADEENWQRPDDVFRAQLFLGYLAGLPRTKEKSTSTPSQPTQPSNIPTK